MPNTSSNLSSFAACKRDTEVGFTIDVNSSVRSTDAASAHANALLSMDGKGEFNRNNVRH